MTKRRVREKKCKRETCDSSLVRLLLCLCSDNKSQYSAYKNNNSYTVAAAWIHKKKPAESRNMTTQNRAKIDADVNVNRTVEVSPAEAKY